MELPLQLVPPALGLLRSSRSAASVVRRSLQAVNSSGSIPMFNETFVNGTAVFDSDSFVNNEAMEEWCQDYVQHMIIGFVSVAVVHVGIAACIACRYKSRVTDKRRDFPKPVDPSFGLERDHFPFETCACCEDRSYLMLGFCCAPCRVGDTFAQGGVSSYWKMFTAYFLATLGASVLQLCLIGDELVQLESQLQYLLGRSELPEEGDHLQGSLVRQVLGNWSHVLIWVLYALLMASERRKLRKKLGGQRGKYCPDCLCYFFCFCCTIIQDARTVDQASSTRVGFPCQFLRLDKLNPVGEPVYVSEDSSSSSESD